MNKEQLIEFLQKEVEAQSKLAINLGKTTFAHDINQMLSLEIEHKQNEKENLDCQYTDGFIDALNFVKTKMLKLLEKELSK